jgi:mannose-6-phosphate isomerase-like protein (cupin superfamily)
VWGSDTTPSLPAAGVEEDAPRYFPPAGGFRYHVFTLPPASATPPADLDLGAALAEFDQGLPGMAEHMEPDNPGMHTTDTIDIDFVISGEVYLELDDGAEVLLQPGDIVVQNGTRHRWNNRSDAPVTMAVAIFGATAAL